MLLLFILIGLLALGLPLMLLLFGDPPAPPAPPLPPRAAVVQPAPVPQPIEVPLAEGGDTPTLPATVEIPQAAPIAAAATPAPPKATIPAASSASKPGVSLTDPIQIPGLPEGTKMPTEAELMKELQRLLDQRAKAEK